MSTDFAAFLRRYPDAVRCVAVEVRELIFATLPEPQEMIDVGSKVIGYGYRSRYADIVCTIIPSKGGVKLGLAYGASLPDPHGLLEGTGKVHRHVNFKSTADVRRVGVKQLLKAALVAQRSRQK